MKKVRVLAFDLAAFDNLHVQNRVNEVIETIDEIGYFKDIKINTCSISPTQEIIVYTIIYEEA